MAEVTAEVTTEVTAGAGVRRTAGHGLVMFDNQLLLRYHYSLD
jgi:hypothetical protein